MSGLVGAVSRSSAFLGFVVGVVALLGGGLGGVGTSVGFVGFCVSVSLLVGFGTRGAGGPPVGFLGRGTAGFVVGGAAGAPLGWVFWKNSGKLGFQTFDLLVKLFGLLLGSIGDQVLYEGLVDIGFVFQNGVGGFRGWCSEDLRVEATKLDIDGILLSLLEKLRPGKVEYCVDGRSDGRKESSGFCLCLKDFIRLGVEGAKGFVLHNNAVVHVKVVGARKGHRDCTGEVATMRGVVERGKGVDVVEMGCLKEILGKVADDVSCELVNRQVGRGSAVNNEEGMNNVAKAGGKEATGLGLEGFEFDLGGLDDAGFQCLFECVDLLECRVLKSRKGWRLLRFVG